MVRVRREPSVERMDGSAPVRSLCSAAHSESPGIVFPGRAVRHREPVGHREHAWGVPAHLADGVVLWTRAPESCACGSRCGRGPPTPRKSMVRRKQRWIADEEWTAHMLHPWPVMPAWIRPVVCVQGPAAARQPLPLQATTERTGSCFPWVRTMIQSAFPMGTVRWERGSDLD